jgi:anti-anti-sigma factor
MGMTDGPRARLDLTSAPDGLVIALSGELDLASLPAVAVAMDDVLGRPLQPVVLDLGGLTFLDSSGVAVLVRIANHFGQVRTRAATPPVRRVIEVLGLAERFGMEDA